MKVLHLTDSLKPGGVTTVIHDLAALQSQRHQVRIGSLDPRRAVQAAPKSGHTVCVTSAAGALASILWADVVHCHHRTAGVVARVLRRQGVIDHVHNRFDNKRFLSFRGDRVVCVSKQLLAHTQEYYPHIASHSSVILNGVNPGHSAPSTVKDGLLSVVGVGRMEYQKNPLQFVEAVRTLLEDGLEVRAVWLGSGSLREAFQARVKRYGLEGRVQAVDWTPRQVVVRALSEADVLLMVSRWEGLPMVALESLSLGTPVVSTPIGDFTDILTTTSPPWVFSELCELPAAVRAATAQGEEARSIALKIWQENFDLRDRLTEWDRVYEQAL